MLKVLPEAALDIIDVVEPHIRNDRDDVADDHKRPNDPVMQDVAYNLPTISVETWIIAEAVNREREYTTTSLPEEHRRQTGAGIRRQIEIRSTIFLVIDFCRRS